MAFTDKTKLIAKQKSAFRCCICHKPFVEVHHIIPQEAGGSNDIENAAALCATCHDLYGGNPEKRKIIRQMRDHWWELMNQRRFNLTFSPDMEGFLEIEENDEHIGLMKSKGIAIYHVVFENEDFITSAKTTHELIKKPQDKFPNQRRLFFLDIDGHRLENGAFDHDMFELQRHYLQAFLMPYISELYMPLICVKNSKPQRSDVPIKVEITENLDRTKIRKAIDEGTNGIWFADKDKMMKFDK